jgi:hypothetical protein
MPHMSGMSCMLVLFSTQKSLNGKGLVSMIEINHKSSIKTNQISI